MEAALGVLSANGLRGRLRWLVKLRWIAIAGLAAAILLASLVLDISLPLVPLAAGVGALIILNTVYSVVRNYGKAFAHVQIAADLTLLAYFVHFSGGAENPGVFFFVLHMVIGSTLLSRRWAYLLAVYASVLLGLVFLGESTGVLPHHHPAGFIPVDSCRMHPIYATGVFVVIIVTVFAAVFLATSIVREVRKGERRLEEANRALEKQDRVKSQYVLRVSHDIKSSLSTIAACVRVVLSDLAGPLSDRGRDVLERAERRTRSLLAFVRDLLDLSRIRSVTAAELTDVDVDGVIRKAVEQVRAAAKLKGVDLTADLGCGCVVSCWSDGLDEVMRNLIGNAVKYTGPGGSVAVRATAQQAGKWAEVTVADSGIGIKPEDLPFIFDDFYRAKNATKLESEGSGLGLPIAKQIVESIGGSIRAESEGGSGTQFHVLLPLAHP